MDSDEILPMIFAGLIAACFVGYICNNMCKDYRLKRQKEIEKDNYGKSFIENNEYDQL